MENVWGSSELMRMDVPSVDGEYVEAEVIDGDGGGGAKRRHDLRFVRPLTVFFAAVFAVSMVGGYVGGGAFYTTIEAAESLVAQLAGGSPGDAPVAPTSGGVPVGSTVITADGLRIRCSGSFVKPGRGEGGEPVVVVALEVQNVGDEKVVLRKNQFAAIGADGKVVEPLDQTISRGDDKAFQFTSVVAEPGGGEVFTVCSSFYEVTDPAQVMYRPGKRYRGYGSDCTAFDIGGAQETMLA